jgi:hypothetical protein
MSSLRDGEKVEMELHLSTGEAIAVTSQRVLVLKAGLATNCGPFGSKAISYPYRNISSVEHRRGPMGGHVTILAAGVFENRPGSGAPFSRDANYKRENVVTYQSTALRGKVQEIVSAIQQKLEDLNKTSGAIPRTDLAEQLARLGQLKNSGVLSDDEFIAAKQRLISGQALLHSRLPAPTT